jgi:hypothetical protein
LLAVLAAAITAFAAWLSFASLAVSAGGAGRAALLPMDAFHAALSALAGVLVLAAAWNPSGCRRVLVALSPLALVLLPWIPIRVPAAFLLWTGPLLTLVWIACAIGVVAVIRRDITLYNASTPRRQCLHAGLASFFIFALAAWSASPSLPGGDEPHYLVITQSLLYDHDLQIENNHRRGDYHAYFAGDLNPDFIQRGRNGAIYSIHAPGVPALVLPAFAVGGYHGVVVFLLIVASAAAALAWWLAWRVTESPAAAWFGWTAVALCAPFLVETYTVYPDGLGAAVVLTGVWALLRADWEALDAREAWAPWFLHGVALALLPWMHTRFAVIAATLGGLILVRLARTPNPMAKAIAFLAAPAASALAWLFFFVVVYGMPDPSAPYGHQTQNSFAYLSDGLGGLLLDQGFGLLFTAPVLVVALAGFARVRRLAIDYAVVLGPYLLAVATFAMWWAGWSGPARFLIPLVLPLTIPAACAWKAAGANRGLRAAMSAALVMSLWLSAIMVAGGGGRLAYHARNENGATAAPWADWLSRGVDIASALPAYVPLPIGTPVAARQTAAQTGTLTALPWGIAAALIVFAARRRARAAPEALSAGIAIGFAVAAMVCATVVWRAMGDEPLMAAPSQLSALRTLSSSKTVVVDVMGRRIVRPSDYLASMSVDVDVVSTRARGPQRGNRPLAVLPAIPAGDYELSVGGEAGEGWVMAGIAPDQFAIVTEPLAAVRSGVALRFPVDVRSIVVRSDETARDAIKRVALRPLRLVAPSDRLTTDPARRAVRYGTSVVYFLDDRAFAEPSGFWVGGARSTSIVIAPDRPASSITLVLRNAPVQNDLTMTSGQWHDAISLAAGEEREVRVPIDRSRNAALVRLEAAGGFRPSDQGGRDTRFLGAFVRIGAMN